MKATWFLIASCIAAGAIVIGCGDSGGGGGGSGGSGGGGAARCADGKPAKAVTVSCKDKDDDTCFEYRTSLVDIFKESCVQGGGEVVSSCPRPSGYLGSCLLSCSDSVDTSIKFSTEDGFADVAEAKATCEGSAGVGYDSQGGGAGGSGGGGGGDDTCTEASVPSPFKGACVSEGMVCIEFRGTMTASQIEAVCAASGVMTFRSTPCEKGDEYLGTCLEDCGQPGETATAYYSMGGLLTEEDMKDDCEGKWFK